jgi:hypothetical protein
MAQARQRGVEYRVQSCTGILAEQGAVLRVLRCGSTGGTTTLALRRAYAIAGAS